MSRWVTSPATAKAISLAGLLPWDSGGWDGRPAPRSLPLFGPHGARASTGWTCKLATSTATAYRTSPAASRVPANGGPASPAATPAPAPVCGPLGPPVSPGATSNRAGSAEKNVRLRTNADLLAKSSLITLASTKKAPLCGEPGYGYPVEIFTEYRPQIGATPQRKILPRSEEHTSELQSLRHLVCRLLLVKKNRA